MCLFASHGRLQRPAAPLKLIPPGGRQVEYRLHPLAVVVLAHIVELIAAVLRHGWLGAAHEKPFDDAQAETLPRTRHRGVSSCQCSFRLSTLRLLFLEIADDADSQSRPTTEGNKALVFRELPVWWTDEGGRGARSAFTTAGGGGRSGRGSSWIGRRRKRTYRW